MEFISDNQVSELAENNSGHNSELFSDTAGGNTMESVYTGSVSGVPPPDTDGGELDTPVTSRQLLHLFADFEERMTRKMSCEMSRLVFQ